MSAAFPHFSFFVFISGKSDWQTEKKKRERKRDEEGVADEIMISDRFARV